ncbi:MAG TPA: hypothetical protein VFF52_16240, partial [Isosphaeraceae bacterium]|nr:hypothetical protein [Isosphaeraceae bacterium]
KICADASRLGIGALQLEILGQQFSDGSLKTQGRQPRHQKNHAFGIKIAAIPLKLRGQQEHVRPIDLQCRVPASASRPADGRMSPFNLI